MKQAILVITVLLFVPQYYAQTQWAYSVVRVSSQNNLSGKQIYKATQVLGKPSKLPATGFANSAWTPATKQQGYEYILVQFAKPEVIRQVAIGENVNPGSIKRIVVYSKQNDSLQVFMNENPTPVNGIQGRMFSQVFEPTQFSVYRLKVEMDTKNFPEYVQIDCIGISNDTKPIEAQINLSSENEITEAPMNLGKNVNSSTEELCPVITPNGKGLFFTRQNHPNNIPPIEMQDVWFSAIQEDGTFGEAVNIGEPINNKENSSLVSITPDGQQAVILNVYHADGTMEKGVSTTNWQGENWGFPKKMIIDSFINDNQYGEYCLSNSGQYLLMTVERNDSEGGKDIYVSFLQENGHYSVPKSIGELINTAENETSPFLSSDERTLYFSTKGHSGYGGNDMFVTRRLDDTWTKWTEPINLGPQINTPNFDAYFSIPAKGDYAYFASYNNSFGASDIFRVKLPSALKPEAVYLVKGITLNKKTKMPMRCKITYKNITTGKIVGQGYSDSLTGKFEIVLPKGSQYAVLAEHSNFYSVNESFDLRNAKTYQEMSKDLYLVPIESGEIARLNNLFFDFNKASLKPESFVELDYLLQILKKYPNLEIQIQGHTDDVGDNAYNLDLSNRRAKEVYNYLVNKGVNPERLKYKGFGETQPLKKATDDAARQLNRRVEFLILKS